MSSHQLNNINVISQDLLPTPERIKRDTPMTDQAEQTVLRSRQTLCNMLDKKDSRLFVVVGPCSIHDTEAAMDYAARLHQLSQQVAESMFLIMRVYFEKPRTTVGWKGLINDPFMDDSFHIEKGLTLARQLLRDIAQIGLPTATEALDPITPQYLSDLITWTAIGARTTESQTHREMASGLSTPVGIKNGTDGSLGVAINAMHSVSQAHHFLGIDQEGQCTVFRTRGNPYAHVVLRGGGGTSNYDTESIAKCMHELTHHQLPQNIVVDCSHGNSHKDPANQSKVAHDCINQIITGNPSIIGLMLESNIHWGNQTIPSDLTQLKYGISVTDACIDWETTEKLIYDCHEKLMTTPR